jgi:hypothetical protein
MKRCLTLTIIAVILLAGCTSVPSGKGEEDRSEQLRSALRSAEDSAVDSVPSTVFQSLSVAELLPTGNEPLVQAEEEIPRLDAYFRLWEQQVKQAFRDTLRNMPSIMKPYVDELAIENPSETVRASDHSVTDLLFDRYRDEIAGKIQSTLNSALSEADDTYRTITDRYAIWSRAMENLGGKTAAPAVGDPAKHLEGLFLSAYRSALEDQEEAIRTTPMPQGTGSVYEIFQQELNHGSF